MVVLDCSFEVAVTVNLWSPTMLRCGVHAVGNGAVHEAIPGPGLASWQL